MGSSRQGGEGAEATTETEEERHARATRRKPRNNASAIQSTICSASDWHIALRPKCAEPQPKTTENAKGATVDARTLNESLKPSAERREQSETKAEGKRPRERFTHCAATKPRRTAANNNREGRGSNRRCAHPERKNGAECGRKGAIREAHTHRAREGRTHTMRDMNAQTRATTQRERERDTAT